MEMDAPIVQVTGNVEIHVPLPVIPLYDLQLVPQLIPCKLSSLRAYLHYHKQHFPAVYRFDSGRRRIRLLSATDIKRIRAGMLRGPGLAATLVDSPLVAVATVKK